MMNNEMYNKVIAKGAFSLKIGRYVEYKDDKILEVAPNSQQYQSFHGTKDDWNQNLMKMMYNTKHIFNEWLRTDEAKMWKDKYSLTNYSTIICHIPSFIYCYVIQDFINRYSNDRMEFTENLSSEEQPNDEIHLMLRLHKHNDNRQFEIGPKITIKLIDFNQTSNFQLYF